MRRKHRDKPSVWQEFVAGVSAYIIAKLFGIDPLGPVCTAVVLAWVYSMFKIGYPMYKIYGSWFPWNWINRDGK